MLMNNSIFILFFLIILKILSLFPTVQEAETPAPIVSEIIKKKNSNSVA